MVSNGKVHRVLSPTKTFIKLRGEGKRFGDEHTKQDRSNSRPQKEAAVVGSHRRKFINGMRSRVSRAIDWCYFSFVVYCTE